MSVADGMPYINESRRAEQRRRGRRRLKILAGTIGLILVIVVAFLIDAAVYKDKVRAGVTVSGVTLGSLSEDEATAILSRYVSDAEDTVVTLVGSGRIFEVTPGDVGVQIDVEAAVAAAMAVARDSNFIVDSVRKVALLFRDKDLPLEGTVDPVKMSAFLAEVAREVDEPALPAGLAIDDGVVSIEEGRKGRVVDWDALREQLSAALLSLRTAEITIPMAIHEPTVLAKDNSKALADAETMIGASISLIYGEHAWTLTPDDIAAYIDVSYETNGDAATIVPYLSAAKMSPLFDYLAELIDKEPVDAWFKSNGQMAWVEPGSDGWAVNREATAQALTAAALKGTGRRVAVVVDEVEPELTTKEAEAMGISNRLGGYETVYDCPEERKQNVRVTTEYADAFVAPGERYNFDRQIGARTPERGFVLAPGITGEKVLEDVLGGGICQVSTTVFNAVLEAGLEIVERHNHSLYIDHYPPGRDATVTEGAKNFQFKNDTDHWVWVHGWSDGVTTRFNVYGTDDGREVEITWSGWNYGPDRTLETVVNPDLSPGETVLRRAGQQYRSGTITRTVTMPDGTILHKGPEIYETVFEMITRIMEVDPTVATPPAGTTTTTG